MLGAALYTLSLPYAAAVTLLAIAGTIEGLLSASDAPAAYKYAASAASAVFLFLYLRNGSNHLRRTASPAPPAQGPRSWRI